MKLINRIKNQPVKFIVSLLIVVAIVYLFFIKDVGNGKYKNGVENKAVQPVELSVFVQDGCYYCEQAEHFLNVNKFKNVNVVYYNLKDKESQIALSRNIAKYKIPQNKLGTPVFFIGDNYIIGFGKTEQEKLVNLINENK